MNFMYNYVELNSFIYLEHIIFCLKYVYITKKILFLLLKEGCIFICREKPNGFQYSLVTIHYFFSLSSTQQ